MRSLACLSRFGSQELRLARVGGLLPPVLRLADGLRPLSRVVRKLPDVSAELNGLLAAL